MKIIPVKQIDEELIPCERVCDDPEIMFIGMSYSYKFLSVSRIDQNILVVNYNSPQATIQIHINDGITKPIASAIVIR